MKERKIYTALTRRILWMGVAKEALLLILVVALGILILTGSFMGAPFGLLFYLFLLRATGKDNDFLEILRRSTRFKSYYEGS